MMPQRYFAASAIATLALTFLSLGEANAQGPRNRHSVRFERAMAQYLTIADEDQTGLDLSSDFTIEAWVKPVTSIPTGQEYVVVSKWSQLVEQKAYVFLYYHDGTQPNLRLTTSASPTSDDYDDANLPYTLTVGEWSHVAAVFLSSTGTAEYYVDGTFIGSLGGFGNTVNTSDAPFEIGIRNALAVNGFDGYIDEVRVWSSARTASEIATHYQCSLRSPATGLEGSWTFEGDLDDSSGNGNTLIPVNGPLLSNDVPFSKPANGCP